MTSTYAFETTEDGRVLFRGERDGYIYGRTKNPTQSLLEQPIASLEGGEAALAVASGMAAIGSTFRTLLNAGDEVIIDRVLYGNSFAFFTKGLTRFGIAVASADLTDLADLDRVLTATTRAVFFETPAYPNLRVIDIAAVSAAARGVGAMTVVDNTFATPVLQQPLKHGADLVIHSATKFIGGHGDVLAGLVVGAKSLIDRIRGTGLRALTGACLSPFNAFLILRGQKTLELRMERHSLSAQAVAEFLAAHSRVASVSYPGLSDFPQRALARRQMRGFGGLISFELKGGVAEGMAFMSRLEMVTRAVSLGDAETLVQHPASMTHATYSAEERRMHGISDSLLRLSINLETLEDIVADLAQGLDQAKW